MAEEGVAETGAIRNGRLYDMGKIKYSNEDKYKGHFNDGRPSKHGELKYHLSILSPTGELEAGEYFGNFKNGKRHGRGVMKWEDGSIFEGEWNSDERVKGILRMTNGFVINISLIFDRSTLALSRTTGSMARLGWFMSQGSSSKQCLL